MSLERESSPQRRPEFDDLTSGWGADSFDDLMARCHLLKDWWATNFPLTMAELKVASAMTTRLRALGGQPPLELPN